MDDRRYDDKYFGLLVVAAESAVERWAIIDEGSATMLGLYINNEAGLVKGFHVEK